MKLLFVSCILMAIFTYMLSSFYVEPKLNAERLNLWAIDFEAVE